jgi:hypothetical protein
LQRQTFLDVARANAQQVQCLHGARQCAAGFIGRRTRSCPRTPRQGQTQVAVVVVTQLTQASTMSRVDGGMR